MTRVLQHGGASVALTVQNAQPSLYIFQPTREESTGNRRVLQCSVSTNVSGAEYGARLPLHIKLSYSHAEELAMDYELECSGSCWMINGPVKGKCLISKDTRELTFTMVPLHSGMIALPFLAIAFPGHSKDAISVQRHSAPHCIHISQPKAREKIFVLRELSLETHE